MYQVSLDYQGKIKENNRLFESVVEIQHSKGVLYLSDKDLVAGTLTYTESSQAGEEFTIGSTVASDISFTIMNKPEYDDINFMGAVVTCNIGLLVEEGADAHFMQPSQPSKMPGHEEKWEYVPLGRFNIDYDPRQRNTIELKAIDNMIKLDIPYSLSKLSYPATLYQIYVNICNVADVPIGTAGFPNQNHVVNIRPDGDLTLRDVLGYVAELAGCFAKCNRNGALELLWYKPTGLTLDPSNRFDFKPSDDEVRIKGIMATVDDKIYLAGTDEYAIDLTDNPLLQGEHETVLRNIFNNVKDTVFTPYTSNWQGNMALQAGDMITQIDRDGKAYNTLVTKSTYKYRGKSMLEGKGLPEISKGYKGSTDRKIAQIKRKIDIEIGDKLTTMEEQILASTELIANMLGGYAIQHEDAFYIADNKDLSKAVKVWKWGLGGFGYSENGVGGPYTTAITADGSIVAMLVAANIITANMIQAGILQSEDGSTWINLDNGYANFKEQIKIDGSGVRLIIGDQNIGNYISMRPRSPLNVYSNHEKQIELWTIDSVGGYLFLYDNLGRQALRMQAMGYENGCSISVGRQDIPGFMRMYGNSFQFYQRGQDYSDFYVDTNNGFFTGDLSCGGAKPATVKTEHYGYRRLYAEESDRLYFNTKGIEKTTDCKFIIRLDDVFFETIEPNSKHRYIPIVTPMGDARVWVDKVYDKYIIVKSNKDCEFSYNIQCTRKDYGEFYLEERDLRADRIRSMEG